MNPLIARLGDQLYRTSPALYRPLYSLYKAISDRRERTILRERIGPGMTVVDVGANIGIYTNFLSELVGPTGMVYAFEPESGNFRRLEESAAGRSNIRAVYSAVGDRTGSLNLFLSGDLNVDHQTYDAGDGRESVTVPVVRLDDFFPAGLGIDLLKIDVQGFELHVLRGAERILTENRGLTVLFEYWPWGLRRAGVEPEDLLRYLRDLDFGIRGIGRNPGEATIESGESPNRYLNLVANRK